MKNEDLPKIKELINSILALDPEREILSISHDGIHVKSSCYLATCAAFFPNELAPEHITRYGADIHANTRGTSGFTVTTVYLS